MTQLSVWEKESFFAPADIVIAGSGLVGLWSAYYLKKHAPSLSITIVERGLIPTGASTRNAGFACFGSLSELVSDAGQMGMDQLLELVDMRYRGLKKIRKTFPAEDIGYEKYGGYELLAKAHLVQLPSSIDEFNRPLQKITGQQKTLRLPNQKIAPFGFPGHPYPARNKADSQPHPGQ